MLDGPAVARRASRSRSLSDAGAVRHGYGRKLIEEALPYSLGAEARFELGADTLRCQIRLPLTTSAAGEMAA